MDKYKTILLDADGTFLDFKKSENQALKHTFKKYNIPFTDQIKERYEQINSSLWKEFELGLIDKKTVIYSRFINLFKEFDMNVDGITFEDDYQEALGNESYLLPDAYEILSSLSTKYDLYVVTNGVSYTQHNRLNKSGVKSFFKDVFVSEDIGYQKPMKEYFQYCFERIENFQLEKTLIIGDSLSSDIQGGINMGIDTCWIHDKNQHNEKNLPITYEINNLNDLKKIL